jgi:hypothetical protein
MLAVGVLGRGGDGGRFAWLTVNELPPVAAVGMEIGRPAAFTIANPSLKRDRFGLAPFALAFSNVTDPYFGRYEI